MENAAQQSDDPSDPLDGILAGVAQVALPLARMYLGPSAAVIERSEQGQAAGERRVLMFAVQKLVVEAGTLPAPGAAYEPHSGVFTVDEKGQAPALDLRYLLAALRALSAWAGAGPTAAPDTGASASKAGTSSTDVRPAIVPATSTRTLRASARARSYGALVAESPATLHASAKPVATGGCGCRAGTNALASNSPYTTQRAAARHASAGCDCGGTCAGRGCGCAGTESCGDCIPRGAPASDTGKCGCPRCAPSPEACTPWTPSCETRNRLRACVSGILCELLRCVEEYVCVDALPTRERRDAFRRCLVDLLCRVLRCVREALCPPPAVPAACPPPNDCLPCSYAVEALR